jgi:hypothetical protein
VFFSKKFDPETDAFALRVRVVTVLMAGLESRQSANVPRARGRQSYWVELPNAQVIGISDMGTKIVIRNEQFQHPSFNRAV